MKMIPACILCFVVGGIFGNLLPSGNQAQEEGGAMDSERLIGSGNTRRGIGSDLGSLNGSVREEFPLASGLPDPPESKDLMVVSKELINQLSLAAGTRSAGLSLFSKDGKLEESLQIADREKAEIQTAWRESLQKIRDLEAASSTAVDLDDGSVRITVPVLAIEMGDVGELFQSSVKSSLGENRGDVFLAMKQIDRIFEPGDGARTYEVALEPIGDGGTRYRMSLEGPAGRRVWVSEKIPDEIRHLTDAAQIFPEVKDLPDEVEDCE